MSSKLQLNVYAVTSQWWPWEWGAHYKGAI